MKDSVSEAVDLVSELIDVEVEKIRADCDHVLNQELYWFPVRHHSPAVARKLEQAMRSRKPRVIFLEGPNDANSLLPFITDAKTRPPVAIYSSFRDDDNVLGLAGIASAAPNIPPRFSCWFPLLSYSPEYVAIMVAKEIGAEVILMDLPHYALVKPFSELDQSQPEASVDADGDQPVRAPAGKIPKKTIEIESDRLLVESGFFEKLSEVAGYRSWNEAWDSLFEIPDYGLEQFRRELTTFCAAARATAHPERVLLDGTVERERFMLQTIDSTLAEKGLSPADAMVVCGGFHLFLDRLDKVAPPVVPHGTVYNTVVPYSYFRVSELSGYAAGNRAPQFYQQGWDLTKAGRRKDLLVEYVISVLKQVRKSGESLSSADAIAVCQTAEMLAGIRKRAEPVLDDITDALITCCCKGDPASEGAHLLKAMQHAAVGSILGRVTPALGQLPIVNDFYNQLSLLDLGAATGKEKRLKLDLDKRQPLDNERSIFFHRLSFIEVPLAKMTESAVGDFNTGKIFGEKWTVSWSPAVEANLIEKNSYGDSVESAALSRLQERMAEEESSAVGTCRHLVEAINMDLPNVVKEVEEACSNAIDKDSRFSSLSQALGYLLIIDRYAVYRNLRKGLLDDLIVRCFDRACFSILDVVAAPEEQQSAVVNGLLSLAEAMLTGQRQDLDRGLFVQHVRQAAALTAVPFLRGVFLGLLTELRELPAEQLAAEVSALAKAPVSEMVTAGDFLDGVMAVSRTSIMLGADALINAIDELLRAAEWEVFLTMIPKMRAAFVRLHERQRESLAERVAQKYGLSDKRALVELKTSVGAAARIADIDRRVAVIMKDWEF